MEQNEKLIAVSLEIFDNEEGIERLRMKGYLYHYIDIDRMYKQALGGQKE